MRYMNKGYYPATYGSVHMPIVLSINGQVGWPKKITDRI